MKILVINAGSSSLKYQLIDMTNESVIAKGLCERIAIDGSVLTHKANGKETVFNNDMPNHEVAIKMVLDALVSPECGVIKSMDEISAVGHRVVHSAEDFTESVLVNDEVLAICERNSELAPLHNPANVMGIKACQSVMPNTPMVAVFDTAFHSSMPDYAYLYGIRYDHYKKYKIRKYGFHGTSHMFVSNEAANYMGKKPEEVKVITCHLGNGSSIAAVNGGKSVDTSMGFTPLEGVPMGTRSGNIDPSVIEYLMQKEGWDIARTIKYLNKECGVLGMSENSSDFRDLMAPGKFEGLNKLAVDAFAYNVKKYVGSYAAVMNGVDCIVFTAGVGENDPYIREAVAGQLSYMGVDFDVDANNNFKRGQICEISKPGSKVKVLVIPTNEELVIARETQRLAK